MYEMKYPHLFSPLKIGKLEFKNRILAAPMGYDAVDEHSLPTMNGIDFYERRALGGAASVALGETTVDSVNGKMMMKDIELDSPWARGAITPVADAIKKHGAIASLELMHPGMLARYSYFSGNTMYAPVDCEVSGGLMAGADQVLQAKEMPEEVIEGIIQKFGDAALLGKETGFDMVMINAGHGWLIPQFMSPVINTRTDKWGGSHENRMRLPIEICKKIKEMCGKDFPIEFRMSGSEGYEGGYDINTGIEIAKSIQDYVDIIHVSTGIHEDMGAFFAMEPTMFAPEHCNLKYAAEIKKHVKVPVAAVGGFTDVEEMEKVIADGTVDFICLARALMADPDLPKKARAGKTEDIRKCLKCLNCFSSLTNSIPYCALNPEIGREYENKYCFSTSNPKKIMVAGGGIAGMQAALTAAKRGHEVVLCEAKAQLGGVLRCEKEVPFKQNLHHYLTLQERLVLNNPNIEVLLNTPATKDVAAEINPDAIIVAAGAKPIEPIFIKGYDGKNIIQAEEVYYDLSKAGQKVVILGGGLVGTELAMYLKMNGRDVTIIEMMPQPSFGSNFLHGMAVMGGLMQMQIPLELSTKAIERTAEGVIGENADGKKLFEADTVICAVGMTPRRDVADELRFCAPEFYTVGDLIMPTNIANATKTGHYAGIDAGRF